LGNTGRYGFIAMASTIRAVLAPARHGSVGHGVAWIGHRGFIASVSIIKAGLGAVRFSLVGHGRVWTGHRGFAAPVSTIWAWSGTVRHGRARHGMARMEDEWHTPMFESSASAPEREIVAWPG